MESKLTANPANPAITSYISLIVSYSSCANDSILPPLNAVLIDDSNVSATDSNSTLVIAIRIQWISKYES
jgi:hypothetical protein